MPATKDGGWDLIEEWPDYGKKKEEPRKEEPKQEAPNDTAGPGPVS